MNPNNFSKKDYQNFFQFCQENRPDVTELFLRYELQSLHERFELAIDFSDAASKKYTDHLKKMRLVIKEQGLAAAEAMLEENNRLKKEMQKADRKVAKLQHQIDCFSKNLREGKSC
ncbi:MAG: hypothetical protein SPK77_05550 [Lachnospiraceae bacterium]|nr:hypothetical protein [Lachnospiraceae bacterium]